MKETTERQKVRATIDLGGVDALDALDMLEELKAHGFRLLRRHGTKVVFEGLVAPVDIDYTRECFEAMQHQPGGPLLTRYSLVL